MIFDLRIVPELAAICRSLVHRKGKKRAMPEEGFSQDDAVHCALGILQNPDDLCLTELRTSA
jgi:hypothetical protein